MLIQHEGQSLHTLPRHSASEASLPTSHRISSGIKVRSAREDLVIERLMRGGILSADNGADGRYEGEEKTSEFLSKAASLRYGAVQRQCLCRLTSLRWGWRTGRMVGLLWS